MKLSIKRKIVVDFKSGDSTAMLAFFIPWQRDVDRQVVVEQVLRDYMNGKFSLAKGRKKT